jgi:transposase InsO family protein
MRQEGSPHGIDALCRLFGKSRQAYYERSRYIATASAEEDVILSLVRDVRKDFPRMGARKLLVYLQPEFEAMHLHVGRDAFIELLYRNFLLVRRYRNRRKTTFSNHWMHKYPNLTAGYTPVSPNRLWVSDITYIDTEDDTVYLSLVTDACSRKIVGWNLSRTLRSPGSLAALKMALSCLYGKHPELIHHSDRGSQYCCRDYVKLLTRKDIQISMTESGDPRENAIAERINGILKTEWIYDSKKGSWEDTVSLVGRIIDLYNDQRPHQSISYMTPALVHQMGLKTERKWKNYYRNVSVPVKEKTRQNVGTSPEPNRTGEGCPVEESEILQRGNPATATPPLHCLAANRKPGKKQANRIIQEI